MYSLTQDPTDDTRRCSGFGSYTHPLVLQVTQTGEVSRICFVVCDDILGSTFVSSSNPHSMSGTCPGPHCCSAVLLARVFLDNDVLVHFNQLCESLGDTLIEVRFVIVYSKSYTQEDLVQPMRMFRDQMPTMKERGCLSFRIGRYTDPEVGYSPGQDTILENVFEQKDRYWTKVKLDD